MKYKTLLALHPVDLPVSELRSVARLSSAFDAHVDTIVLDLVSPLPTMAFIQDPDYDWNRSFPEQLETIERHAADVRQFFEEKGVKATVTAEAQQLGLIGYGVAKIALASDLVVTGSSQSLVNGLMGHALEGALFGAGKPVLVLGKGSTAPPIEPSEAMIAWDGGPEAGRAVQQALPLLQAAENVRMMIIEADSNSELEASAQRVKAYLQRHDIHPRIEQVAPAGRLVANAFAEHVASRGPDLLIMGAYGHTRLRERLFSGVTRSVLSDSETPLFLAH